jgi:hypothetical protein
MSGGAPSPGTPTIIGAALPNAKLKFTPEEDSKLLELVAQLGPKRWIEVSAQLGTRNPRQCRERYNNYLNPELRQGLWTAEEDALLEKKYREMGAKWNKISKFFVNRSDNSLRNRWMMLARHQAKEKGGQITAGWRPSVPIVLPILKDPSLVQTVASRDAFEMLEALLPDDVIDDTFGFWPRTLG